MPPEARSRKAKFYILHTSAFPYATHRATLLKSFLEGKHFVLEKSWEPWAWIPHSSNANLQQTAVIPYCHQETRSLQKGEEWIIPPGLWALVTPCLVWQHSGRMIITRRAHMLCDSHTDSITCFMLCWQMRTVPLWYFRKRTSQYLWISLLMESKGLCFIATPIDTDKKFC